jgi:hypothetical protein
MSSDKFSISRRRMLISLGAMLVAPRGAFTKAPQEKINIYIDESGHFGSRGRFVIGALVAPNGEQHLRRLLSMRDKSNYRLSLRYNSSDKHKVPYAQQLLDYFFAERDLRFCAYALTPDKSAEWQWDPKVKEIEYHGLYRKLLVQCTNKNADLSLNLKQRTTTGEDQFLYDYLKQKFTKMSELNVLKAYQNDFMQFADLLVGSVAAGESACAAKQTLIEILKANLSVKSFLESSLINHRKFSVMWVEKSKK